MGYVIFPCQESHTTPPSDCIIHEAPIYATFWGRVVYLICHAQLGDPHLDAFSSRAEKPRTEWGSLREDW